MKKTMKNLILLLLIATVLCSCLFVGSASAYESYSTYTYDIDGNIVQSPAAYSAGMPYDSYTMGLDKNFGGKLISNCTDIFADADGYVYIADQGKATDTTDMGRVVILDQAYKAIRTISTYVDEYGRDQQLNHPRGLYVTNPALSADENAEKEIYVCDTDNAGEGRIVIFNANGEYKRTIDYPNHALLLNTEFRPNAIAVDKYNRILCVSPTCRKGVIVLSSEGEFTGFIGAQKVSGSVWDRILRRFKSAEDREETIITQSDLYCNITVDDDGFIYVCSETDSSNAEARLANLRTKDAAKSPVKKLNSSGAQIMNRNGFFDPSGEVTNFQGALSNIVDIAVGPEGTWSILDDSRGRVYTYSANGELLYVFGDIGDSFGTAESVAAQGITYQKTVDTDGNVSYVLLMLDKGTVSMKILPYTPTPYCDTIMEALACENRNEYEGAEDYWQEVKTKNNNFDLAYIGIGKALYSQGRYDEAMEILEKAYETQYYALAFSETLSDVIGRWLLLILVGVIAVCVLLAKFLGYAKRKNKATSLKVGRKSYGEELLYVFHLVFHPFDGFWDLKHEKRGSMRAAWTILGITALALFYNSIGKAYIFNPRGGYTIITASTIGLILLVVLWVTGNWCLTTLFDGEGSYKDVFIASCYAIAPMSVIYVISTLLTNVLTDSSIINLLIGIGLVWSGFLLFFGMQVTHDYSLGKNVLITICTIVAMVVIMFVALLFTTLMTKMVSFFITLFTEIGDRI